MGLNPDLAVLLKPPSQKADEERIEAEVNARVQRLSEELSGVAKHLSLLLAAIIQENVGRDVGVAIPRNALDNALNMQVIIQQDAEGNAVLKVVDPAAVTQHEEETE